MIVEHSKEIYTLLDRCANQAARATVKEIERHIGKELTLYDSMCIVRCFGMALEGATNTNGVPVSICAVMREEWRTAPSGDESPTK